ncbi:hypothetical protein PHLCEN_2v11047 [Hermanssonia centrifuga]|uniref:Uncharacterized protein n=1 Tax=Hermanssonia centrifuga TaxID=98765 RepID=A0A2R6NL32_9APHY|nr:hypothetical protein PHLCEN_2v11047 [Hermanssonia centrifuga]
MAPTKSSKVQVASTSKKNPSKTKNSPSSLGALRAAADAGKKEWMYSKNTSEAYAGYVKRAQQWVLQVVGATRSAGESTLLDIDDNGKPIKCDEFALVFENPPNRHSAHALELFLVQKCVTEGNGKSTDNDTYRGSYRYNASTDTVTGNPASSARVQDMLQALKNKSRANGAGGRNHAEAMLIEDLRKLLDWSTSQCPNDWLDKELTDVDTLHFVAKHLMMRAFTTSGYETNFSDALSPVRREARQSFAGEHTLVAPVSTAEFREYTHLVDRRITEMTSLMAQMGSGLPVLLPNPSGGSSGSGSVTHGQNRIEYTAATIANPPSITVPSPSPSQIHPKRPLPTVTEAVIPDLPKNRKGEPSTAWKTAVKHWTEGDASIGLSCALKSWPPQWFSGEMSRVTGAKYKQRETIGREYER